jgi:hypothetical protein
LVVQSSQIKLKNLGITLDPDPSFDEHIKTVSRTASPPIIVTLQKAEQLLMQKGYSMLLSLD